MLSRDQVIDLIQNNRIGEVDAPSLFQLLNTGDNENQLYGYLIEWATQTNTTMPLVDYLVLLNQLVKPETRWMYLCVWFALKGNDETANKIIAVLLKNDAFSWPTTTDDEDINNVKDICAEEVARANMIAMWLEKPENDLTRAQLQKSLDAFGDIGRNNILAQWVWHGNGSERVNEALQLTPDKDHLIIRLVAKKKVFNSIEKVSAFLGQSNDDDVNRKLIAAWSRANRDQIDKAPIVEWISHIDNISKRTYLSANMFTNFFIDIIPLERYMEVLSNAYGKRRFECLRSGLHQLKDSGHEDKLPRLLSLAETVADQDTLIKSLELKIERPPIDTRYTIEYWIDQNAKGRDLSEFVQIVELYDESRHESIAQHWFEHQKTLISYEAVKQAFNAEHMPIPVHVLSAWARYNPPDDETFIIILNEIKNDREFRWSENIISFYHSLSSERNKALLIREKYSAITSKHFCKIALALSQFNDENFKLAVEGIAFNEGKILKALREAKPYSEFYELIKSYETKDQLLLIQAWIQHIPHFISYVEFENEVLKNIKDSETYYQVLSDWVMRNPSANPSDDKVFCQILNNFKEKSRFSGKEILSFYDSLSDERNKALLVRLKSGPITTQDFCKIAPELSQFTEANYKLVAEGFNDRFRKSLTALRETKIFREFYESIKSFDKDDDILLIQAWVKCQPKSNSYEYLEENVLKHIDDQDFGIDVLINWLNTPLNNLSVAQMCSIVDQPSLHFYDQYKLCRAWAKKTDPRQSINDIDSLYAYALDHSISNRLINDWLENFKPTFNELKIEVAKLTDAEKQVKFYNSWLSLFGQTISPEKFNEFLETFPDHATKMELTRPWAKSHVKHNKLMLNALEDLYESLGVKPNKLELVEIWLSQDLNNISLKKALELISEEKSYDVSAFVDKWLSKNNISDDEYCELISHLSDRKKESLISSRIEAQSTDAKRYEVFLKYIQLPRLGLMYHPNVIIKIMQSLKIDLQNITQISSLLYPNNDFSRSALFYEATKMVDDKAKIKTLLLEFLPTLKEDDVFAEVYNVSNQIKQALTPLEWLNLAENRVAEKYATLKQFLDLPIEKALTPEGLSAAKAFFNDELTGKHLSALFMFFDLINQTDLLKKWMDSTLLTEMINNFSPPSGSPYLTEGEHEKLFRIGIPALPSMQGLCAVLNKRTPRVPPLEENIANVAALKDEIVPSFPADLVTLVNENREYHEKRKPMEDELYKLFNTLGVDSKDPAVIAKKEALKLFDEVRQKDVTTFFEKSMQLDAHIKSEEGKKLFDYFDKNMNSVIFVFSHPDGRMSFQQFLGSLGEGCVANIGTQSRIATYRYLFKDDIAGSILYACFADKIVSPIFSTGDKLGASPSGTDPFTSVEILRCAISPPGLVVALVDSYYSKGRVVQDVWAPIGKLHTLPLIKQMRGITDAYLEQLEKTNRAEFVVLMDELNDAMNGYHLDFIDVLDQAAPTNMSTDEKAARFLIYLTLRAVFPEMLAHPSIGVFNKENQGYLSELNKVISTSEASAPGQPILFSQPSSPSTSSRPGTPKPDKD